jgi:chromosomal replication initiation ATPase DnaA
MRYLINRGTEVIMRSNEEIDALKMATNMTKTTGSTTMVYQLAYEVKIGNEAVITIDHQKGVDYTSIIKMVREINNLDETTLMKNARNRKSDYVICRQWEMFILQRIAGYSSTVSGEMVGRKDHATALHASRKILAYFHTDKNFRKKYEEVITLCLKSNPNAFDEK